jgi:hypothetical protein
MYSPLIQIFKDFILPKQLNLNISSNGNRIAQFPNQAFIELITPNVFEQNMQILKFSNVSFNRLTSVTQYLAILVRSTAPILELQIKQQGIELFYFHC